MSGLGDIKRKVAEYEARGNLKKAVEELEKAVQTFSQEGSLFNKLGDLYIKLNRKDEALAIYERGARVFKEETYYPNAIALCKKILRLDKNRTEVYKLLGDLHRELGQRGEAANYLLQYADRKMKENDLETALETYNTVKELVPNNPKILKTISAIYEKVGREENGEVLLEEAAKIETEQEKIKESVLEKQAEKETVPEERPEEKPEAKAEEKPEEKAEAKLAEKREEKAEEKSIPKVEEVSKEEKPAPEPEVISSSIERELGLKEIVLPEAGESKKEEVVPEPREEKPGKEAVVEEKGETTETISEVDRTAELGELYLSLGSEEEAIDCFRRAAREAQQHKNFKRALELNKKIADLRPFDLKSRQRMVEIANAMNDKKLKVSSLLELAESLARRDAKTEAQRLYEEVLKIDPENPIAKEMLATIGKSREYVDLGAVLKSEIEGGEKTPGLQSIDELITEFRREVFESIGESDFRSHYDLGVAYKGMGLYQEAIEEFEIAAKDEEIRLKAYEMIASCMLERNKVDDAIRILNEGLKFSGHPRSEYFGLYFLLGNCYEQKNDFKNALRAYVNAYNIDKSVPDLIKKITKLKDKVTALIKKKPAKPQPTKVQVGTKKSKITYL